MTISTALDCPLPIPSSIGGSGVDSLNDLKTELSLGTMSMQDSNNVTITGGSISGITDLSVGDGGTGASNAPDARTNLGLGTMAIQDNNNVLITVGIIQGIDDLHILDGGTGASTAADARTNLGLGSISTQNSNSVSITGGSITGITDLSVADGGTAASTAPNARTNLGFSLNSTRSYSSVSLAFNTSRTPNTTHDVLVIASVSLNCDDGESSTVNAQVDTGSGFTTIATASDDFNLTGVGIGGNSTIIQSITFICPMNTSYKLISSGAGVATVASIYELIL